MNKNENLNLDLKETNQLKTTQMKKS